MEARIESLEALAVSIKNLVNSVITNISTDQAETYKQESFIEEWKTVPERVESLETLALSIKDFTNSIITNITEGEDNYRSYWGDGTDE